MSCHIVVRLEFLLAVLCCCAGLDVYAQDVNIGTPPLWNFSKKTYQAGTQNWDAAQDSHGVLYWANNEGLLRYDGAFWSCLPVANRTIVRSVAIDENDRIYVGAQSELGYFYASHNGCLHYQSLVGLLPAGQRTFEDVWDIAFHNGHVFFRTNRSVFQYDGRRVYIHQPGGDLTALFATPKGLFLQQGFSRLLSFNNNSFTTYVETPQLASALTGAIPWMGDTLLFSSLKNGIFYLFGKRLERWATPHDALIKEKRVYTATALPDHRIALGTSIQGVIIMDRHRRIFRHLTKKHGLQNNNILCAFNDRAGNLWLGLDNGIDCVVLHSPFSAIFPDGDLQGTGYTAAVYNNQLYLGVSNGLYVAPWQSFYNQESGSLFTRINASEGQVWSLNTVDDAFLLGHHEGAFAVKNSQLSRLSAGQGAWTFVQLSPDYLLGGTYNGLILYKKTGQNWVYDRQLEGLNESCRIMVKDADGTIWVSHPYRGLYRVQWSPKQIDRVSVAFFGAKHGLPSDLNNYVFAVAGKAVFATEKGVYRYQSATSGFVPDADFNRALSTAGRIKYLREDTKGNVWFVSDKEVGVLQIDDLGVKKEVRKQVFPELLGKLVGGFEFIYPIDVYNVIIGAEHGFIHYNAAAGRGADTVLQVVLNSVSAGDSSLLGAGICPVEPAKEDRGNVVLKSHQNNLRFTFSATDYANPAMLEFRVKLDGLNEDWSDWSPETHRDYTNLGGGEYTFQVQARRKYGLESNVEAFTFRIRPPWYAGKLALALYAFALVGLAAWFFQRQQHKFETEKAQLTVTHQAKEAEHMREVELSKAALIAIQNEKLEADIRFRNQELATATMHLVQKGEILLTIQEALNQILEKSTNPAVKKEIQQLLNLLDFDAKLDDDWQHFALYFDQVHVDFLKCLREQYPQLSQNDYKLCAYLRMNLSTKEIASLMNISVRGVEASRYRLRKKLNLPNDANLVDFLMEL